MKQDGRVWFALSVIMICFAANSVITRYLVLVSRVSPFLVTIIRFVSGLVVLVLLTSLRPSSFPRGNLNASFLPGAIFLGAYAFSISYGYVFISVAAGTFVFYTFVVLTMGIYSVIIDHEKLTARSLLGQVLGLVGVLVITVSRISSVTPSGIVLMAVTGTSWGLYSAYGKKFQIPFHYTFNSFLILGLFAVAAWVMFPVVGSTMPTEISIRDLGLTLYMGTISTALSYVLWNRTVKKIPAYLGGLVQLVVPVLAPIMGIVLLGERVTVPLAVGGGLVLLGIYLAGSRMSSARTRNRFSDSSPT